MIPRILAFVVCGALMCGCSSENKPAKPIPGTRDYVLYFEGEGWRYSIYINDIPIVVDARDQRVFSVMFFVKNGENVVSVEANKEAGAGVPSIFHLKVAATPNLGSPEKETPVAEFKVAPNDVAIGFEKQVSFNAEASWTRAWEKAPVARLLLREDRENIMAAIRALASSLEKKDVEAYLALRKTMLEEMAKVYGFPPTRLKADAQRLLLQRLTQGVRVTMKSEDELLMTPRGGLVYVRGADAASPWIVEITSERQEGGADEEKPNFWGMGPFWLAKVEGEWRIVWMMG